MKICTTCHALRPLEDFNVMRRAPDGRQARCRECCKAWYLAHREQHMANAAMRKRRVYAENRLRLRDYFEDHPCVDCGEGDVRVLEFDHRDRAGKTGEVSRLLREGHSWSRISAEIALCDVRCANCHRRRTAEQFGTWRDRAWRADQERVRSSASQRPAALFPKLAVSRPAT